MSFFAILVRVTPGRCPTEKVPEIFIPYRIDMENPRAIIPVVFLGRNVHTSPV